jgi:hypothetical protein
VDTDDYRVFRVFPDSPITALCDHEPVNTIRENPTTGVRAKPRRALISAAVGLISGLLVLGVIASILGGEYQPDQDFHAAVLGFSWCAAGLVALGISVISLRGSLLGTRVRFRASMVVTEGLLGLVLLSIAAGSTFTLSQYVTGHNAYNAAVKRCGGPPLLGDVGFESKTYMLPGDAEYERLKYTIAEFHILGPSTYFCTVADAESAGFTAP